MRITAQIHITAMTEEDVATVKADLTHPDIVWGPILNVDGTIQTIGIVSDDTGIAPQVKNLVQVTFNISLVP